MVGCGSDTPAGASGMLGCGSGMPGCGSGMLGCGLFGSNQGSSAWAMLSRPPPCPFAASASADGTFAVAVIRLVLASPTSGAPEVGVAAGRAP
jgi:hypothetical protein